jgi:hypothetical protein
MSRFRGLTMLPHPFRAKARQFLSSATLLLNEGQLPARACSIATRVSS